LDLRREVSGNENRETLGAMANLSATYEVEGRYPEAEALQRELLATRTRIFGPEHADTMESMQLLANTLEMEHNHAAAEQLIRSTYEILLRKEGPNHPDTIMAMTNLAATLKDEKRWAESKALYDQVLPIELKVLGEQHFLTMSTRAALAEIQMGEGDWVGAEKSTREVVDLNRKVLGETHPDTISHMGDLGAALAHQHKEKESEQVLGNSLQLAEKSKQGKSVAEAWYNLASAAAFAGHRDLALDRLQKAVDNGYDDTESARADDDLKSVRDNPRFERIVTSMGKIAANH
jgi:tetratricopeptide (TPR) repeat protein